MKLLIQLMDERAKVPTCELNSNGYDVFPLEETILKPNTTTLVDIGVAASPPEGHYIRIAMRSSYSKLGLIAGAGVVDWNYRGSIKVCVHCINRGPVKLSPDKAFAQLVIERCAAPEVVVVESLDETERGAGGFGSTDAANEAPAPEPRKKVVPKRNNGAATQLTELEKDTLKFLNNSGTLK